ncbi:hypothetical protein TD95_003339 [Thielaviopsis punctulata]|uniref:Replication factor A protein 3 n=1 Tax=Thielaviopsis punctulata TaxID=72032 RepID=A0A0F4Z8N7_9PEZI|nr:hypothetical protein TD95_003339 [Thielaviopsis punctulata]
MTSRVSTPRIDATLVEQFVGRTVILVGRVVELRGDTAMVESKGMVTVALPREAHLASGNGVHIVGKVGPDHTVKVLSAQDLGPSVGG